MARGMSRRTLLTGGMLAAAGAVMAPALSACAQPQEGQTAGQNREQTNAQAGEGPAKGRPSVTHDIDVVIVGGGISGCFAAMNALELGSSVAVIDKGQWGHSGTSGYNWGGPASRRRRAWRTATCGTRAGWRGERRAAHGKGFARGRERRGQGVEEIVQASCGQAGCHTAESVLEYRVDADAAQLRVDSHVANKVDLDEGQKAAFVELFTE